MVFTRQIFHIYVCILRVCYYFVKHYNFALAVLRSLIFGAYEQKKLFCIPLKKATNVGFQVICQDCLIPLKYITDSTRKSLVMATSTPDCDTNRIYILTIALLEQHSCTQMRELPVQKSRLKLGKSESSRK